MPERARDQAGRGRPQELAERRASARAWLRGEGGPCRIKLCGMYRDEDIAALNEVRPDLCGFVSGFSRSHRNVEGTLLARLASRVDPAIRTVAVLVDQPPGRAAEIADAAVLDIVQLHGHEDASYVAELRARFDGGIVQAFRIRSAADVERALASVADLVLVDAGQGSGETFDWSLVEGLGARRPYLLAGGLTPEIIGQAVRDLQPWGVDLSSGIETDWRKDPAKMAAAVAAVRAAEAATF